MKLSIAMIVKNEEENIEKSLKSFKKIQEYIESEIIVVDTGSTDNTIFLAKKYTDKVYYHEWSDNFAEMRNISMSYCTGEWILVVDADEVLKDVSKIIDFFKKSEEQYNSVLINFENTQKDNNVVSSKANIVRLFRNEDDFKYEGIIHEQPKYKEPLFISDITFLHYGYDSNDYKLMNYKFNRNVKLLKDVLKKENNPYIYFQLSQSYAMANKDSDGLKYIEKAYNLLDKSDDSKLYIYHLYSKLLINLKEFKKSLDIINEAIKLGAENIDFYYFSAKSYSMLGEFELAIKYYKKYLEIRKSNKNIISKDSNIVSISFNKKNEVIRNLFIIYTNMRKYNEIINEYNNLDNKLKREVKEFYFKACLIKMRYKNLVGILNSENDINIYIETINSEIINLNERSKKILCEELIGINSELDSYLNSIIIEKNNFEIYINYDEFCFWKAEVLKKELFKDFNNIEKIKYIENENINKYIEYIVDDYLIIGGLIEYSKKNLFNSNFNYLSLLLIIEERLIESNYINGEEFESLVIRLLYNKTFYFNHVYNNYLHLNEKLLNNDNDKFFIKIIKTIKNENKLNQIKELRSIVKIYPNRKRIFEFVMDKFIEIGVNKEMKLEKENIISLAENYISSDKIDEALYLLEEILKIFKTDKKVLNDIVVANFIKNNIEDSYKNLAFLLIKDENYIDSLYNLSIILEKQNRIEDSIYYYEKLIRLSNDKELIIDIKNIIYNLRKNNGRRCKNIFF